jgi:hypothetical protein
MKIRAAKQRKTLKEMVIEALVECFSNIIPVGGIVE